MSKRLRWKDTDFGQEEADASPFRYILWSNDEHAELRIIRKDNIGGILVPISDFSVYARDRKAAKKLASEVNRAFYKARHYNRLVTL